MGAYALRIACMIGIVVLTIALILEVRNWCLGRRIISRKQQVFRSLTGLLMITLFTMIFMGTAVTSATNPIRFILYWMGCFVIACAVVVLMLLDLREVGNRYREQHREMMKNMAEDVKRK